MVGSGCLKIEFISCDVVTVALNITITITQYTCRYVRTYITGNISKNGSISCKYGNIISWPSIHVSFSKK